MLLRYKYDKAGENVCGEIEKRMLIMHRTLENTTSNTTDLSSFDLIKSS